MTSRCNKTRIFLLYFPVEWRAAPANSHTGSGRWWHVWNGRAAPSPGQEHLLHWIYRSQVSNSTAGLQRGISSPRQSGRKRHRPHAHDPVDGSHVRLERKPIEQNPQLPHNAAARPVRSSSNPLRRADGAHAGHAAVDPAERQPLQRFKLPHAPSQRRRAGRYFMEVRWHLPRLGLHGIALVEMSAQHHRNEPAQR